MSLSFSACIAYDHFCCMKTIPALLPAIILGGTCFAQQKNMADTSKPAQQLQAVTITAKTPLIRREADRIIYNLQADPQSKISSVLDMMHKVPYLSVDGDDNILLKGSTGYKVFINGRPSGLVAGNPKEVLRSMPASTIKSIEVITSPPARYDAEGLAGIINIITIGQLYNGYKGSVNVYEKGPVGGPGAGGSFTFKQARFGLSALAGISNYKVPGTAGELRRTGTEADPSALQQYTSGHSKKHTAYAELELSYEIDSLDLISGQFSRNKNAATGQLSQVAVLTGTEYRYYQLNNNNRNGSSDAEATVNYQRGFKADKDQLLTCSWQYLEDENSLYNDIVLSDKVNYTQPDYRQYNSGRITRHTAQIDYVQPVRHFTVEAGIKANFRKTESDFQYNNLNTATGMYETDPTRSNTFRNSQNIFAAYNSYAYESVRWHLDAGARLEGTIMNIACANGFTPLQQKYLNMLPAIAVTRKFKNSNSLSFSFTKRIQRPSVTELNPFTDRSDPNFVSSGSPYLRPITSDVYEISYLKSGKATLNASVGGMFFNHVISPVPFYDTAAGTTFIRHENYGRGRVLKTNISLNYPFTPKWNMAMNADIRHVATFGSTDDVHIKNSGWGVYADVSGGYRFEKGWQLNAAVTWKMGGILLPYGSANGFVASSLNISRDISRTGLTISASVSNPFTTYRYASETIDGPNFLQTSTSRSYYRRFAVSANYRFGKLKEDIRKNRRGIYNDGTGG